MIENIIGLIVIPFMLFYNIFDETLQNFKKDVSLQCSFYWRVVDVNMQEWIFSVEKINSRSSNSSLHEILISTDSLPLPENWDIVTWIKSKFWNTLADIYIDDINQQGLRPTYSNYYHNCDENIFIYIFHIVKWFFIWGIFILWIYYFISLKKKK